ncbi:MAG: AAA domain-containing protein, partial [Pseudomonadota bacterium]
MKAVQRTVNQLQQRLNAAINRSPLLNVRVTATGRLFDCAQLTALEPNLPEQLIDLVLDGKGTLSCEFDLQAQHGQTHQEIYDVLERRIRRHAERASRETGVHALWLGYPLIALTPHQDTNETPILAPILLWPLELTPNLRQEGQLRIKPDKEAGPVRINSALWSWARRNLKLELPGINQSGKLERAELETFLQKLAESFHTQPTPPSLDTVTPVPSNEALKHNASPQIFNAAVLGSFQWPHAALLADLDALQQAETMPSAAGALLSGKTFPDNLKAKTLAETDRWEVYPADFSQQQVIQHTRHGPGLVVHGPPGTGKSQTIVNIIADALAHDKKVLMVCQKQAALQVVYERLRAVKLDELCVQVNDADTDRLTVFREIRDQVERLPPEPEPSDTHTRNQLAEQIASLEKALDAHAAHLNTPLPGLDIDYPAVLATSAQLIADWPRLKVLPALQRALRGVGKNSLDTVCESIRAAGNLFGQSHPPTNLWRGRRAGVRASAAFQAEIKNLIENLRELDKQHIAYVEAQQRPVQLPEQVTAFSERIQSILTMLDELKTPDESSAMLLAWLRTVRATDDTILKRHQRNMQEAVKNAETVSVTPLDPDWHSCCAHLPEHELTKLDSHARSVMRHHSRWWQRAVPGYSKAVEALQALRPIPDALLRDVANELHRYIRARQVRAQLRYFCQTLTPGIACHDEGEAIQSGFVMQSHQAFNKVLWLRDQEQTQPWLSPFITQIQQDPPKGLTALQDEVEHTLERIPLADTLLQQLKSLELHLNDEALAAPGQAIHDGKSIEYWLDDLLDGLDRLPALISYEEAVKKRRPAKILLEALEHYEVQRSAKTSAQPEPPETLMPEEHGAWWE